MSALKSDTCQLASYMLPWKIIVMDEFPLTVNGKIDRKAIGAIGEAKIMVLQNGENAENFIAPETQEEVEMCTLWQSILRIEDRQIGMTDNFFELGGHYLRAMELAMALSCDVRLIMSNPSPLSLLDHLQQNRETNDTMDKLIQNLVESDAMTRHEQQMLFIHLQDTNSNSYNMPFSVQFHDSIDVHSNLSIVLESMPIFSTRFVNGKAVCDIELVIKDLQEEDDGNDNLRFLAPFDLQAGPLCWFDVDSKRNILKGCVHHSISDGRSMDILLNAIVSRHVKQSTKDFSVRKYAALEASEEITEKYASSVEHWKRIMEDTPPRLEVDFSSADHGGVGNHNSGKSYQSISTTTTSASTNSPSTTNVRLDGVTVASLCSFCQDMKVSMFSVALSILHHTMRAYSHDAFAIGVVHNIRPCQFQD